MNTFLYSYLLEVNVVLMMVAVFLRIFTISCQSQNKLKTFLTINNHNVLPPPKETFFFLGGGGILHSDKVNELLNQFTLTVKWKITLNTKNNTDTHTHACMLTQTHTHTVFLSHSFSFLSPPPPPRPPPDTPIVNEIINSHTHSEVKDHSEHHHHNNNTHTHTVSSSHTVSFFSSSTPHPSHKHTHSHTYAHTHISYKLTKGKIVVVSHWKSFNNSLSLWLFIQGTVWSVYLWSSTFSFRWKKRDAMTISAGKFSVDSNRRSCLRFSVATKLRNINGSASKAFDSHPNTCLARLIWTE